MKLLVLLTASALLAVPTAPTAPTAPTVPTVPTVPTKQRPAPAKPTEATVKLYTAQCQACHGPDGKSPLKEMAFVDRAWKHGTKTADMVTVITEGVPGTMMMPFKGRLTEAQILDLARYVRSLDPKLPPEKK